MSNPWTKKNPMLSIWLSAANTAAATARSRTSAAAKQRLAHAQSDALKSMVDFWTGGVGAAKPGPKRRWRR